MYRWLGSDWSAIYGSGEDLKKEGVYLYSSQDKSYNSELGDHVIPLPESDKGYEYLFLMMTAWRTDASHTTEYSSYYIPIVKSDVEIVDMKLVDKDGYYADRDHLTSGDVMTVHYFYKNNTDCTIYVKGYNDDMSQIPGIFAIPAGETIEVEGASHTVPNELSYNIWGGVYLSTVSIFDTDYESDGSNNANLFPCQTGVSMSLTAIAPNAPYRETTEVISTFRAWNHASSDILPNNEVYARIRVYKKDETTPFVEMTKKVVSPGDGSNIVYFKWTVPSGLGGNSVTVKGDLFRGDYYWSETSDERATIPFTVYQTPDTQYEENAPSGFTIPNAGISSGYAMQWSEYVYDGYSGLVKRTYRVGLNVSSHDSVSPALTGIAESHDNGWIMKSGYGITVLTRTNLSNKYGAVLANSDSYTLPQYVYVLYPEYGYAFGTGTATTLERYYSSATYAYYRLPVNGEYGRVHFTPLWYPDGAYQIKVVQSDCWTPVGMINLTIPEKVITISGSAYDDWYAGRRNR